MNTGMKTELNYKVQVEPTLFAIFNKIASDLPQFNITQDDFTRAVWAYADSRLQDYTEPPQWLWLELAAKEQARDAANTIEGVAGDE
jgi:hypothetical protein